ncbi:MAG: hypothetical protein ACYDCN_05120 [Bacteroidia bacterium]
MRKVEFNVHPEIIVEFVEELTNRELSNSLIGTTEEGEIIIEVEYLKTESAEVNELDDIFEKLSAQIEDEDED